MFAEQKGMLLPL